MIMHELGIADSILNVVRDEARDRPGERLVKVGVRLGRLAGVDPDALAFSFEALVSDSDLEPLALDIEMADLTRSCPKCGHRYPVDGLDVDCPKCGEQETKFVGGDELEIAYLEVEES